MCLAILSLDDEVTNSSLIQWMRTVGDSLAESKADESLHFYILPADAAAAVGLPAEPSTHVSVIRSADTTRSILPYIGERPFALTTPHLALCNATHGALVTDGMSMFQANRWTAATWPHWHQSGRNAWTARIHPLLPDYAFDVHPSSLLHSSMYAGDMVNARPLFPPHAGSEATCPSLPGFVNPPDMDEAADLSVSDDAVSDEDIVLVSASFAKQLGLVDGCRVGLQPLLEVPDAISVVFEYTLPPLSVDVALATKVGGASPEAVANMHVARAVKAYFGVDVEAAAEKAEAALAAAGGEPKDAGVRAAFMEHVVNSECKHIPVVTGQQFTFTLPSGTPADVRIAATDPKFSTVVVQLTTAITIQHAKVAS